jgi:hypothetical protein
MLRGDVVRWLALNVVSLVLVACGAGIGMGVHQVTVPGGELHDPLPVTLEDRTGWVTSMGGAPPGDHPDGVTNPAGDPTQLVVTWLGGLCDDAARLTLEAGPRDTLRVLVRTDRPNGCLLAGVMRTVVVEVDRPVAAERVEVVDTNLAAAGS